MAWTSKDHLIFNVTLTGWCNSKAFLEMLTPCPPLEILNVCGTDIDGDCIAFLGSIPTLRKLNLRCCEHVSLEMVENLQKMNPNLEILFARNAKTPGIQDLNETNE